MLEVALLGCGGSMPIPERSLSALLINHKGKKILVDCGEGTQVSMKQLAWGFKSIDIICITHSHADHTIGLPGLLATIRNSERTEPLTIIGPKGITNVVNGLRVVVPYLDYEINIIENPGESIIFNEELQINTIKLDHTTHCLGYSFYIKRAPKFDVNKAIDNEVPKIYWNRLQKGEIIEEEGKIFEPHHVLGQDRRGLKVSYITDTRPTKDIPDFVQDSDLFICEAMYGDNEHIDKAIKNKHMTFKEAATLAKAGQVHELVLTHFSPSLLDPNEFIENATSVFEKTEAGYDRMIKKLNFQTNR